MDQLVGTRTDQAGARRERLLAAARGLTLERGFAASTVDRICEAAGVTKGTFFHYFEDKDALGRAVAERFAADLVSAYQTAAFRNLSDPLDRVFAYVDFTDDVTHGHLLSRGCLIGALSVELAEIHPDIRALCSQTFEGWSADLAALLREAGKAHTPAVPFDPDAVARLFLSIVEGALILGRAHQDPKLVTEALIGFNTYLRLLFGLQAKRGGDRHARTRSRRR